MSADRMIEGGATMQSSCGVVVVPRPKKAGGLRLMIGLSCPMMRTANKRFWKTSLLNKGVEGRWQLLEGVDVSANMISRTVRGQESSLNPSLL